MMSRSSTPAAAALVVIRMDYGGHRRLGCTLSRKLNAYDYAISRHLAAMCVLAQLCPVESS